jgi:hypothetical protein
MAHTQEKDVIELAGVALAVKKSNATTLQLKQ